jgi:hypothetical protein
MQQRSRGGCGTANNASGFQIFEFCLGNLKFVWIQAASLGKDGGRVSTHLDVVLNPVSRVRYHIPEADNSGKFCKQAKLLSAGKKAGIG